MTQDPMRLRPTQAGDMPQILALNEESVHFLSPMTPTRLEQLHAQAAYHRVVDRGGHIAGFLLAFREGCQYDSPNYKWFAAKYEKFLYIDRVVVSQADQGRGVGRQLYADLFNFARQSGVALITCEFDTDPPNEPSRRFHAHYGFEEVGAQSVASGKKRVSLQAVAVEPLQAA